MSTAKSIFACAFAIAVVTGSAYAEDTTKPKSAKSIKGQIDVAVGNRLVKKGEADEKSKNVALQKVGAQDIAKGKADIAAGEKLGAKDPMESKLPGGKKP